MGVTSDEASRQRQLCIVLGASLLLSLSACNSNKETTADNAVLPRSEVSVVTLHPQSVAITAELPGRTTASLTAEVRPQVGGLIEKRLFREGSEVKAGDVLYQIEPASYQASYDSALAALQKAEATVPSAQSKVDRYRGLVKQNAVSQQDLDDAVATLAEAKADVAAAKASVETAKINLNYTKITAPISGRIDKSSLTPGALVTASQTTLLTTIRTIDPINVDVTQSATNLINLRQAIKAGRIRVSGKDVQVKLKLDNGTFYSYPGTLEFSESYVNETTGTFTARAVFPNPERLLLPGMYVRAIVEEGIAENSFLVPQRAVTRDVKGEPIAMFVGQDGKVEPRVLSIGRNVGNNWRVESGLKDGDKVIVEGIQLVRAGQDVTPVEVTIDDTTGEVRERQQGSLETGARINFALGQAAHSTTQRD
ncbi:efflux RND transporter periplasmic adaptor subunit [Hyphomicrobium sp. MC1]|uniref:efflux RND transporter periplasmic adaptor subunit n=1 Tax=Hyphomicrobium sp. (strain MC1) TaxID=717785 RepID=UPI000213D5A2|nr:efflux RND transporter periplasmic adaptor subunit [Hyphomicrobium sp. MC1]CCB65010.1 RND efflux transporter, MFP subunit [Hyphomicrobium sp. MC1]